MSEPVCHPRDCTCAHTGEGARCCSQVRDLSVSLGGRPILTGVNLHFHCGELTAIVGPNGGGKSTLLRAMVGEVPSTGVVSFQTVSSLARGTRARIGYVPQKTPIDYGSPMTVRDLFMVATSGKAVWLGLDREALLTANHALDHMEAGHLLKRRIATLSGGELQRVLVALALAPIPDVLLMDEPVTGIDQAGLGLFYRMVSRLRRDHDMSIVMVSHDLALAARFADHMALVQGTVVVAGDPASVIADVRTRAVLGFESALVREQEPPVDHHPVRGAKSDG